MARTDDQGILRRYHTALGMQNIAADLEVVSKRFRHNHGVLSGDPLVIPLSKIFMAHALRVGGKSSPAAADEAFAKIIKE